jgi:hypothetical protein
LVFQGAYSAKVATGFATGIRAESKNRERFSGFAGKTLLAQNLDAPPPSPYTSAVPWMDEI